MTEYIFTAILKKRLALLCKVEGLTMVGEVTHQLANFVEWDIKQILEERETMRQLLESSIAFMPAECEHVRSIKSFLKG